MYIQEQKYCFICDGIKCYWNFWLLPKSFLAITLFGRVYFNKNKTDLFNYLVTARARQTMNHERIHLMQAESFKTKYLGFYIYYLFYWVKNLFKYGVKDHIAYRNIPFEKEAFANDKDFLYYTTNWREYID